MGKVKISEMTLASALSEVDVITLLQGGQNKKATLDQLISLVGPLRSATVDIPASQVHNIHNVGIQVLSTPGAGRFRRIINADYSLVFGTVAFVATATPQLQLYYGSTRTFSVGLVPAGAFMIGTQSKITTVLESAGLGSVNISDIENKAIYAMTDNGSESWATGDGVLRIRVTYLTIDI